MEENKKSYLGDGLYAEEEGYMIKLTTERINGTHVIYLEPEVFEVLVRYAEKVWGKKEKAI